MNIQMLICRTLALWIGLSTMGLAQTLVPTDVAITDRNRTCLNILKSCESAGYQVNQAKLGKNIWKDCFNPILRGQSLPGVVASPSDVHSCAIYKKEWEQRKR